MRRALVRQLAIYGLGDASVKALGFVTIPVYTRALGAADYGVLSLVGGLVSVLGVFGGLGLSSAVQRDFFALRGRNRRLLVSTGFWAVLGLSCALAVFGALLSQPIAWFLTGSGAVGGVVALAVLAIPGQQGTAYCQDTIRIDFRPWRFIALTFGYQAFQVALSVAFVVVFHLGVAGIFLGMVIAGLLATAVGAWAIHDHLTARFSPRLFRRSATYSVPLVLGGLAFPVFLLVDRLLVGWIAGEADVGRLAVATSIAQVMALLSGAFGKAWNPMAWRLRHENAAYREIFAETLVYLMALFGLAAVTVSAFAPEIVRLLATPAFAAAALAVPPLTLYMVFNASVQITASGISISGHTRWLTLLFWMSVTANGILDLILIPRFGILGAAVATALAEMGLTLGAAAIGQRLHRLPFDIVRLGLCLVIVVAFVTGTYALPSSPLMEAFALKGAYVAVAALTLVVLRVVRPGDVYRFAADLRGPVT